MAQALSLTTPVAKRSNRSPGGATRTATREIARQDVFGYIEMFYNWILKHARNGLLSQVQFERQQMIRCEGV
jgi:hypothetical protein